MDFWIAHFTKADGSLPGEYVIVFGHKPTAKELRESTVREFEVLSVVECCGDLLDSFPMDRELVVQ